jgi:hypothetical protein
MAPLAILRFSDNTEITTSDEVCVQSLWRLLATTVSPEDFAAVDGRSVPKPTRPPTRLRALEGGDTS